MKEIMKVWVSDEFVMMVNGEVFIEADFEWMVFEVEMVEIDVDWFFDW